MLTIVVYSSHTTFHHVRILLAIDFYSTKTVEIDSTCFATLWQIVTSFLALHSNSRFDATCGIGIFRNILSIYSHQCLASFANACTFLEGQGSHLRDITIVVHPYVCQLACLLVFQFQYAFVSVATAETCDIGEGLLASDINASILVSILIVVMDRDDDIVVDEECTIHTVCGLVAEFQVCAFFIVCLWFYVMSETVATLLVFEYVDEVVVHLVVRLDVASTIGFEFHIQWRNVVAVDQTICSSIFITCILTQEFATEIGIQFHRSGANHYGFVGHIERPSVDAEQVVFLDVQEYETVDIAVHIASILTYDFQFVRISWVWAYVKVGFAVGFVCSPIQRFVWTHQVIVIDTVQHHNRCVGIALAFDFKVIATYTLVHNRCDISHSKIVSSACDQLDVKCSIYI